MAGNKIAPIRLDVRHMFAASLGRGLGLSAGHLERIKPLAATVHDDLVRQRRRGELLIHRLPQQQDTGPVKRVARRLRRTVQDLVVLGIGGSALGAVALQTALCPPFYNLLPDA
ncbi:MAG: hypothetical protein KKC37_02900, partial [Proteobacteria bacterium]|nr:hypothetical protein [Pseudomonadota bacterium]